MILIDGEFYAPDLFLNTILLFFPIFVGFILLIIWKLAKKQKQNWLKAILFTFFLIYLYKLADYTIFPISIINSTIIENSSSYGTGYMFEKNPFELLSTLTYYSAYNLLGNILLFVPYGFFVPLLFSSFNNLKRIFFSSFIFSIFIETTQLILNYFYLGNRVFDVMDLVTNVLGGVIGFYLFKICNKLLELENSIEIK
ncbi:VanZ family protein [Carnobacterium gallinarum]|uniref:VanZ family protein n=1 Tax=Carnobacterium gallinarum TaxID=2749 RepID=UPI00068FC140|nr:VanZ family protein [Carnobacterium gallinarum]